VTTALLFNLCLTGCALLKNDKTTRPRFFSVEKQWMRSTLSESNLQAQVLHRMQPILAGDVLIAGNSLEGLLATDKNSGRILWRVSLQGGVESGAVLHNGHLFFGGGDGFFYKIRAIDGVKVWSYPIQSEGLGLPTIKGDKVFFLAGNGVAHCLDSKTGKTVWRYNRNRSSYLSVRGGSRPLVTNRLAYYGFSDGYLVALDKEKGTLVWEGRINRNKKFKDIDAEPLISGSTLYVSSYDGDIVALNKDSGQIRWRSEFGGYSRPTLANNKLYVSSSNNIVACIDKESGRTLWTYETRSLATRPQFYKGLVIIGEFRGTLKFLDAETGKLVNEFSPGRGVHSQVTLDEENKKLYFMSADANLVAVNVRWKRITDRWPWETLQ
jgi:outer membrane protein assembly factor BamB